MPIHDGRAGFSMVELLVVLAIIALLLGILVPAVTGSLGDAKESRAEADVSEIYYACTRLYEDTGEGPDHQYLFAVSAGTVLTAADLNGASAGLLRNDGSYDNWHGPYLSGRIEDDPWGNGYRIDFEYPVDDLGNVSGQGVAVVSAGPDGTYGNADDIHRHFLPNQ